MSQTIKQYIPNCLRRLYHSRTHILSKLRPTAIKNSERKTLYLHIGLGKTGTTALQEFFWANRRQLAERGIGYPDYCVIAGAHHALSPYQPKFLQAIPFKQVQEWAPIIAQSELQNVLLSSELIAWTAAGLIENYCAELKKYFDLKIIIYVRRQDDLIMATYNQQVKAGLQKKPIHEILEVQIQRFDFKERIQQWENCAGEGNVIIRPFEREQFHEGDIRLDFLHHVFGVTDFSDFTLGGNNSNPRLSPAALEYKRLLNQLFDNAALSNRYNELLLAYSAETDKNATRIYANSPLLSPKDRNYILDQFKAQNEHFSKKYLSGSKIFLKSPPAMDGEWIPSPAKKHELQEITIYIRNHDPALYARLMEFSESLPPELHTD